MIRNLMCMFNRVFWATGDQSPLRPSLLDSLQQPALREFDHTVRRELFVFFFFVDRDRPGEMEINRAREFAEPHLALRAWCDRYASIAIALGLRLSFEFRTRSGLTWRP